MNKYWLFGPPAAVLLGSATPPGALGYSPDVLMAADCRLWAGNCAASYDLAKALAAAERREALEAAQAEARRQAAAIAAGIRMLVSIPQQTLYLFRAGELIETAPVSTGKRGHATPVGTFQILEKQIAHRSNRYANAPMPYMQRLTYGGIALHAGAVRGYPASHGCIRLPWAFAKRLYGMTSWTTRVIVTKARPLSSDEALRLAHPTDAAATIVSASPASVDG